ncbi:entericidin A [Moraxella lacunata]|uniref:Entericidin A n=1 Tax=Moraxella lacunata TaxID=477 RepID=A0A378TUR4_MORLA|nr:entericidin A/B family lipoprotein [Moraxella lacunata]STZ63710.1 entericidin A [Moraxella lacunata]
MKKVLVVALAGMFVLTGCNTIKGFGKDISRTGEAVTDGAQKVQDKI